MNSQSMNFDATIISGAENDDNEGYKPKNLKLSSITTHLLA